MAHDDLKTAICEANIELPRVGLATLTFGNASGADRDAGVMAIKPSGVDYGSLRPEDIVLLSIETGEVIEGSLRPSSDTPTHLEFYRAFSSVGGVVHTHSRHATAFAQAGREIPCFGTTHADHFHGAVPVSRPLTEDEIDGEYERATGLAIIETFHQRGIDGDRDSRPGARLPVFVPTAVGQTLPPQTRAERLLRAEQAVIRRSEGSEAKTSLASICVLL